VADELTRRLSKIFLKDKQGERPVLKYNQKLAKDPHFRDYVLFHEYFEGDNGRGVGASHQTGWTGLIAKLLQPRSGRAQQDSLNEISRPAPLNPVAAPPGLPAPLVRRQASARRLRTTV
jgi:hypothetical protein